MYRLKFINQRETCCLHLLVLMLNAIQIELTV